MPKPSWKAALEALTAHETAVPGAHSIDGIRGRTAMALQFELRELTPRTPDRWNGPTAKKAAPTWTGHADYRLAVRPVIRSGTTGWTKSTLTWANVTHQLNRLALDPHQHRWFCQFVPLHRASTEAQLGQEVDWLYLDDFASPLLWHLLGEARRLGIELVSTTKGVSVLVGAEAEVTLDAVRVAAATAPDAPATGLQLVPRVTIDSRTHAIAATAAIGDHGVYCYEAGIEGAPSRSTGPGTGRAAAPNRGAAFVLAPTRERLSPEQRRLVGDARTLTVPAGEVEEFLGDYYPRMRRSIPIASSDGSVGFPPPAAPVLVLTATFEPKQTLRLAWHLEYAEGREARRMPLPALSEPASGTERDTAAEHDLLDRAGRQLAASALDYAPEAAVTPTLSTGILRGIDAAEFCTHALPALEALDGVRVDAVGERPDYRELTATPRLTFRTVESDHRDWFDLGVVVTIDGRDVPFGPLFRALAKGKTKLLLIDHSYLSLRQPIFERLLDLIAEARALPEWETGVRISRYQASLWSDFEDLAEETEQAASWRAAVSALGAQGTVDAVPLPTGLRATLRPYQVQGFEWLAFLWRHGLGGILADDMGLGKTLQALALILHAREPADAAAASADAPVARDAAPPVTAPPFLVVAPASVVANWALEAARFTPGLVVHTIGSTQATSGTALAEAIAGADIVVTSYTLFRLDFEAYQASAWAGLILDEAQFVKNHASRLHECARDLGAPFKLAITGTPMENHLLELWSLFAVTAPGLFPSARLFTEQFRNPIENGGSPEALARLRRRIRPLMLRRTKALVATELPAKQEQELRIELSPAHQQLYDTFLQRERQKLMGLIDDIDRNRIIFFRSLTLLRMLSLDPSLIDEQYAGIGSRKLDALLEQLDDVVAEGHRALVFSQFTSFLGKAAARLDAAGIEYCYLDGSSTRRAEIVERFKAGAAPVFLISLKAGGFGLNLTEADYVFLLDPWWNPATETQAVDRTHRIGQTRNVMVYRLVAAGTIEEKVVALGQRKAQLFDSVLDDGAEFGESLTADDIRGLLEE
ncbi:superfamily II DNA or RNA helicase [Marisediminicola sp. UYEF4]|uniref:DEAD/DEAH box helicase n=1 Tax=Marisediminicola sp. UYEF4 TaxID=1756384 RepID=UPI00339412EC